MKQKEIKNQIKALRIERGISQEELGLKLGLTDKSARTRISQYESGNRTPTDETLREIAKILDVSEAYFFEYDQKTISLFAQMLIHLFDYGLEIIQTPEEIEIYIPNEPKDFPLENVLENIGRTKNYTNLDKALDEARKYKADGEQTYKALVDKLSSLVKLKETTSKEEFEEQSKKI